LKKYNKLKETKFTF